VLRQSAAWADMGSGVPGPAHGRARCKRSAVAAGTSGSSRPSAQTLHAYWKSQYVDELTDDLIDAIVVRANDRPGPLTLVNTFRLDGAVHGVGPEETAFAERSAPYTVSIDTMWSDPARDDAAISWGRAAFEEVAKYGNGNVFLNFTGRAGEPLQANVDSAFGRNLARPGRIKAAYDRDNLFQLNNNILPQT
jgi:hypothetical protein